MGRSTRTVRRLGRHTGSARRRRPHWLGSWLAVGIGLVMAAGGPAPRAGAADSGGDLLADLGGGAPAAGGTPAAAPATEMPAPGRGEPNPPAPGEPAAGETTLADILRQGGIVLAVIGACSVAMLALAAEALWRMRVSRCAPPAFVIGVESLLGRGEAGEALLRCRAETHFLARVLGAGLERAARGREAIETAIDQAAAREYERFRTRVNYLSVIAVISPMLGLLGTVLGMIGAFNKIALGGVLGDPSRLADEIGEALVTTAGGLIVGVPAMSLFYFLRNRLAAVDHGVMELATRLLNRWEEAAALAAEDGGNGRAGSASELPRAARRAPPSAAGVTRRRLSHPARPLAAAPAGSVPRAVACRRQAINCPACGESVEEGDAACPACDVQLEWEGA